MRRWFRRSRWALVGALFVCVLASWIGAGALIAPTPSRVLWPATATFSPEDVALSATDGIKLKGWFLPHEGSTEAIVLLHGVRANRAAMLGRAFWLHDLGYNVLLYDARGCGESEPTPITFGFHETRDLLGALQWLQTRGMTRIGCVGSSQGAATILLASKSLPASVRAVVAEEPYATLQDTVDDHFRAHTGLPSGYLGVLAVPMAEWKLGFGMDAVSPLREIVGLKAPLYLIGGTADHLAPAAGLRELFAAAPGEESLWMLESAGHCDVFSRAEDQYKQRIGDFLRRHLSP